MDIVFPVPVSTDTSNCYELADQQVWFYRLMASWDSSPLILKTHSHHITHTCAYMFQWLCCISLIYSRHSYSVGQGGKAVPVCCRIYTYDWWGGDLFYILQLMLVLEGWSLEFNNTYRGIFLQVFRTLVKNTRDIKGAKVENHKFCASVHYRNVDEKVCYSD